MCYSRRFQKLKMNGLWCHEHPLLRPPTLAFHFSNFDIQIRVISEAVTQSITDIRDELSDERISMRTEIRQHADEIRRQGIAYERMFSRQQRNENTIGDVQHKCKQISRSICDLGSESMAKIGKNPSKSRISDMRSTTSFYENGLLDYRNSLTDFNATNIDRSSNNSNNSYD